jgi:hypothetical protein
MIKTLFFVILFIILNTLIQKVFTNPLSLFGINPLFNNIKAPISNTLIIASHDSFHTIGMLGDSAPVYYLAKQWYMETGIKTNIITSQNLMVDYLLKPIAEAPFCKLLNKKPRVAKAIHQLQKKENVVILIDPKKIVYNTSCYNILSKTR